MPLPFISIVAWIFLSNFGTLNCSTSYGTITDDSFVLYSSFWIVAKRTTAKGKMPLKIKIPPKQSLDRQLGFETAYVI